MDPDSTLKSIFLQEGSNFPSKLNYFTVVGHCDERKHKIKRIMYNFALFDLTDTNIYFVFLTNSETTEAQHENQTKKKKKMKITVVSSLLVSLIDDALASREKRIVR